MAILDLAAHPWTYVTVAELADYWRVCKEQVLTHLAAGDVTGIELGPRIYRIQTQTALEFERRSRFGTAPADQVQVRHAPAPFRRPVFVQPADGCRESS